MVLLDRQGRGTCHGFRNTQPRKRFCSRRCRTSKCLGCLGLKPSTGRPFLSSSALRQTTSGADIGLCGCQAQHHGTVDPGECEPAERNTRGAASQAQGGVPALADQHRPGNRARPGLDRQQRTAQVRGAARVQVLGQGDGDEERPEPGGA
eukprot:3137764-Rhodomonas_salina.1